MLYDSTAIRDAFVLLACAIHAAAGLQIYVHVYNTGRVNLRNFSVDAPALAGAFNSCNIFRPNHPGLAPYSGYSCSAFYKYTEDQQFGGPQDANVTLRSTSGQGQVTSVTRTVRMSPQPPRVDAGIWASGCELTPAGELCLPHGSLPHMV